MKRIQDGGQISIEKFRESRALIGQTPSAGWLL
jgi:hypothetical protein